MSNHMAIATVTKGLADILDHAVKAVVGGATVDTQRPDPDITGARVYLYLYQVTHNTALRNSDSPTRNSTGLVTNRPMAALDLHYLLTFYGDESKLEPQRMLGGVVRSLLAEPGLSRDRLLNIFNDPGDPQTQSDLVNAFEQVKFTPLSLTLEELSRIWSIFYQKPYGLSIAYLATVVVIESEELVQTVLPVLQRGQDDRGVDTVLGPFPALESIHIGEEDDDVLRLKRPSYPSARLGAIVTLRGQDLGGENVIVRFTHQHFQEAIPDIPARLIPGGKDTIRISVPNPAADQSKWASGIYGVAVVVIRNGRARSSNSLPLSFAPQITNIAPGAPDGEGNVVVTVTAAPEIRLAQSAVLILPDRELSPEIRALQSDPLKYTVKKPDTGQVTVRLRVDGVDNLQFKSQGSPPRTVIDQQKVQFP